ncbi:hypothetical protein BGX21_007916 [Mortierella sp. AD011]|nr:hypothetical protein BGX21_007916 [Mortierella sp. AD011]
MYKRGSCDLYKMRIVKRQLDKSDSEIKTWGDLSLIENYITLNTLIPNPRKIVPTTSFKQPYIGFAERELAGLFLQEWRNIQGETCEAPAKDRVYSISDEIQKWFVADIDPEGLKGHQKREAGRRGNIKLWSLDTTMTHLLKLEEPGFLPWNHIEDGYVSRGTALTDGFGLYLLAFKLKELQCALYRRLPEGHLPPRITSSRERQITFYKRFNTLSVLRMIEQLWSGAQPSDIKILTIDAGQAFVAGAYAHLPEGADGHYNLAVNQKATMQPTFCHRRRLKEQKQLKEGVQSKSIGDMARIRGFVASIVKYCEALESEKKYPRSEPNDEQREVLKESTEERLLEFYNIFKVHG